jgi:hypothetical protein
LCLLRLKAGAGERREEYKREDGFHAHISWRLCIL